MRFISRLKEPDILNQKKEEWTRKFIEADKKRPDSSKYANPKIKSILVAMSHNKCYYCETLLKGNISEIDHFVEVSENKELAYEWTNLYLACSNCNDKISNSSISIDEVIDPCRSTPDLIYENLIFEDECISAKNDSQLGFNTIKKFKLNTLLLDYLRMKKLKQFYKVLDTIRQKQIREGRGYLTPEDKEFLKSFAKEDKPYSFMFKKIISQIDL